MEPVTTPLEPVDVAAARRDARADAEAIITAAWADHHEELYAFLVRTTRDPDVAEDLLAEAFLRLTGRSAPAGPPTTSGPGCTGSPPTSRRAGAAGSPRSLRGLVRITAAARDPDRRPARGEPARPRGPR